MAVLLTLGNRGPADLESVGAEQRAVDAADRPVPLEVAALACLLLLATAWVMTLSSSVLSADGSFQLLQVLGTGDVYSLEARLLGSATRQSAVLLAARAGVTDTHVLTILFGAGYLVIPAIAWSLAIFLSRANALVCGAVTMIAGLCAGGTWLFGVHEGVLAVPLTVLLAVLLWLPRTWRWPELALAFLSAAILVASYETALVTGSVLALWAGWRAVSADSRLESCASALVAALSGLSVAVAAVGTQLGPNRIHSQSLLYFVVALEPWPFYLALAGIAAVVTALGPWLAEGARRLALGLGCAALVASAISFHPSTVTAFQARGGASVAALLLEALLFWTWIQSRHRVELKAEPVVSRFGDRRMLVAIPVLFVAAMVATNIRPVTDWSSSLEAFRAEVDRGEGVLADVDTLPSDGRVVLWSWTSSSLSLIVRSHADAAVLVNRDPPIVPFPPSQARAQLDDAYIWRG